jgi:hypothetical protein
VQLYILVSSSSSSFFGLTQSNHCNYHPLSLINKRLSFSSFSGVSKLSSSLLKVVSKNHELASSLETKTQQLVAQKIKNSEMLNETRTLDRKLNSKKSTRKVYLSLSLSSHFVWFWLCCLFVRGVLTLHSHINIY